MSASRCFNSQAEMTEWSQMRPLQAVSKGHFKHNKNRTKMGSITHFNFSGLCNQISKFSFNFAIILS